MSYSPHLIRLALLALPLHCVSAEPVQVVFQNGRSIPASSLAIEADKLVVKTAAAGFQAGQTFPLTAADHVYGDKPAGINQAIALMLTGKPKDAEALLTPIVAEHQITAKIPGNFWLDAARSLLVAHALNGDAAKTNGISTEISDATPEQGIDSITLLGKALLLPASVKLEDKAAAFRDLTTDNLPDDIRGFASFFRANLLLKDQKKTEALEAYLAVPCLYPSGGLILNAAAELQAAGLLSELRRPEEAVALLNSALRVSAGTVIADQAAARLKSLK